MFSFWFGQATPAGNWNRPPGSGPKAAVLDTGAYQPRGLRRMATMRRTKASLIYKATGNLSAVQILMGHTNIENTVRYLGVDIDDATTLAERTEI